MFGPRLIICTACIAALIAVRSAGAEPQKPPVMPTDQSGQKTLTVDAQKNCVFMMDAVAPDKSVAKVKLAPNQVYEVTVSGEAFLSSDRGRKADPVPGVVLFYCSNEQDGYATQYRVLKPGDVLRFRSPAGKQKTRDRFLGAFFLDFWPESPNRGTYELNIAELPGDAPVHKIDHQNLTNVVSPQLFGMNLTFGDDPGRGKYDGAVGQRDDHWNLIKVGTREAVGLKRVDGVKDDVVAEISEHDGGWGIEGHVGIYHGYIYHNCQCVDLSVKLKYLPAGIYEFYVFAHGDAPNQNAEIQLACGDVLYSGKRTLNDNSWNFRDTKLSAGNQYVRYLVEVPAGSPVTITSKRDGSGYSIFNAIQVRQLAVFDSGT